MSYRSIAYVRGDTLHLVADVYAWFRDGVAVALIR